MISWVFIFIVQTFVKALRPAQMKADSYKADRFLDGKWFFFGSSFVGVGLSFFGATFKKWIWPQFQQNSFNWDGPAIMVAIVGFRFQQSD